MRTKAIGGPLHGQSVFLQELKPYQRPDVHSVYRHGDAVYVHRMWEGRDHRLVPVLVLADLEPDEAFHQALQVMGRDAE